MSSGYLLPLLSTFTLLFVLSTYSQVNGQTTNIAVFPQGTRKLLRDDTFVNFYARDSNFFYLMIPLSSADNSVEASWLPQGAIGRRFNEICMHRAKVDLDAYASHPSLLTYVLISHATLPWFLPNFQQDKNILLSCSISLFKQRYCTHIPCKDDFGSHQKDYTDAVASQLMREGLISYYPSSTQRYYPGR